MQTNPFFYGNPVSFTDFIGRRKELRRVKGRLLRGESTAVIGDPHIGKTSFLNYLVNPEIRKELYLDEADRLYLSLLDVHMLGSQFTPAQFWENASIGNSTTFSAIPGRYGHRKCGKLLRQLPLRIKQGYCQRQHFACLSCSKNFITGDRN
jgi:hypothetical protein